MKSLIFMLLAAVALAAEPGVSERARVYLAPPADVKLTPRGSVAEATMPNGPLVWKCTSLVGLDGPNPRVRVEVAGQDGKRSWVVAFDKQVLTSQKVCVHPLAAGTLLREEDFSTVQVWVPANPVGSPAWQGPYDGRYRLRRAVPTQTPLLAAWIEPVPYCEAGCQVNIQVEQPGLSLTLSGKALERGYPDRPLRVRLDNGSTMQAWYDKEGHLRDRRDP
ncbi:flagella basal body P-ring formation protein FlgA [bacterium]|nr:flagella basal body P-ring formation protein FlgA [bacterium]